jgi:hypothetical protein
MGLFTPENIASDSVDGVRRKVDLLQQEITWKITVNQTAAIKNGIPDLATSLRNRWTKSPRFNALGKYRLPGQAAGYVPVYYFQTNAHAR